MDFDCLVCVEAGSRKLGIFIVHSRGQDGQENWLHGRIFLLYEVKCIST